MKNKITSYKDALYSIQFGPIVFGLTGFTGSGCSTARDILLKGDEIETPGEDKILSESTTNMDKRVFRKLNNVWENLPKSKFISISISKIIFGYMIYESLVTKKQVTYLNNIRTLIKNKDEFLELEYFFKDDFSFEGDKLEKLIEIYERILTIYSQYKSKFGRKNGSFIKQLQDSGDDLRRYGINFRRRKIDFVPCNIFVLPRAVDRLIKAYENRGEIHFVVDSIKNPYEIEYFRNRYSHFILIGIMRKFINRHTYIRDVLKADFEKIEQREKSEAVQPRNKKNLNLWITSQDIVECLKKTDMLISNVESETGEFEHLKFALIKLITLVKRPGCVTPTQDERCMQLAMTARLASGCISRQVGAVVIDTQNRVIGVGWNDPPKTQVPCSLRTCNELIKNATKELFSDFERSEDFVKHIKNLNLGDTPFCFRTELSKLSGKDKKAELTRALHAEENAFFQAIKNAGESLMNSVLYTTSSPCTLCSKKAYQLGVKRIVYMDEYYDIAIEQTLKAGARDIELNQFTGIIGSAYSELYLSPLPEKSIIQLYESN